MEPICRLFNNLSNSDKETYGKAELNDSSTVKHVDITSYDQIPPNACRGIYNNLNNCYENAS